MKLNVNRQEFADALGMVSTVASGRTPKPILNCVLLEAQSDHCLLAATDLEIGIRFTIAQVEVAQKGKVVLPADKLNAIVRESQDEILALESDDSVCHVRGAGAHYQIYTQDAADFPPVSELDGDPDFEIPMGSLRRMAEWTAFAAARENTRYAINGVLWEKSDKKLTLVATDGRRLSLARGKVKGDGKPPESIVPAKAMQLLHRLSGEADAPVQARFTDSQVILNSNRVTLSAALVEGQFPKYRDVIPTDLNRKVTVATADLLSAVRRAALLTNEESRGVRFTLAEDTLTLASRAPTQGEATITLPVHLNGEGLEIGFNPHFLIDALKVVDSDEVVLELKESNRPGLLKAGPDYQYVVMPVSLS